MSSPSAWQVEQVMSVAMAFAERLRADGIDDESLAVALASETDAIAVLERVVRSGLDSEALANGAKSRLDDLQVRRDRFAKQAADARGVAFSIMDALGLSKHVAPDFTLSLRAGVPSVVVTDETALPPEMWRVTRTIDKPALAAALKAGADVPGAVLSNSLPVLSTRKT